ncbi:DUF6642 family protein [Actinokineospora alba]|uniref:DUF6642 family protein n=1 Tax=Actinokineospora alba TaxID=504798 RepID=UPI00389939C1
MELEFYLRTWLQKRYDNYRVLYLACHGSADGIELGGDMVTLADLATILEGGCDASTIYFGSCMAMDVEDRVLTDLVARTGSEGCGWLQQRHRLAGLRGVRVFAPRPPDPRQPDRRNVQPTP